MSARPSSSRPALAPQTPGLYTAGTAQRRLGHYLVLGETHRLRRLANGGPIILSNRERTDARTVRV